MSWGAAAMAFDPVPKAREGQGLERRTTSSTLSNSIARFSVGSSDTGESSSAASKRNSDATWNDVPEAGSGRHNGSPARGNQRSHRSRNSGSFLLSSSFETPSSSITRSEAASKPRLSPRDKGKAPTRNHEKRSSTARSNVGLGIGGSPLAAHVTTAGPGDIGGDATADTIEDTKPSRAASSSLDVNSAQIVNLALNLSESRRNAARRNVSSPLPPLASTFGEGFAAGSLRHHLQQQRRVSRNISPKPQRPPTSSPRVPSSQGNVSSHASFDPRPEGAYQYHFSASTLARAEKAKTQIELMYQYRRLLDVVPPLKPQALERSNTAGSTVSDSSPSIVPLGREYNPLQYIRNRKVRARERKAIDGDTQGFGELEKVISWVDQVREACRNVSADHHPPMPVFSRAAEIAASPITSPHPTPGKSPSTAAKVKRPRIDWDTSPADMLADLFWLEQDDNKNIVEDRLGRKIFPNTPELKRPTSNKAEEVNIQSSPEVRRPPPSPDLRIDTKLPEFKSLKAEEKPDSTTTRVRHKIRDVARLHNSHNGAAREGRPFLRARSRSDSSSSDTDAERHSSRVRRTGTAESHDQGKDILEKQMLEILAKEARENDWSVSTAGLGLSDSSLSKEKTRASLDENRNRSGSVVAKRPSRFPLQHTSSGRASLEVPGGNPRSSLDDLDTTAPNSPQLQAAKFANSFVPSISMDLTPPPRKGSPSRMAKVRSKINPFEHVRSHSRSRNDVAVETPVSGSVLNLNSRDHSKSPDSVEQRPRSLSPTKQVVYRKTDDSAKTSRKSSIRRGKTGDEPSGIRGLFKGNRNPVARVSEFLWKKDSPIVGTSSGFSSDESDTEDFAFPNEGNGSRESSTGNPEGERSSPLPAYDLPSFNSPHERGRQGKESVDPTIERQAREERRRSSRAHLLNPPPRIDISGPSPGSSPDLPPADRFRGDTSYSDFDSRRPSYSSGVHRADARLNDILGRPGHKGAGFPVTGLSGLETTSKRPSLDGKRQWSISDREVSMNRGPMTKREIARVRAVLLSSGIKAKEISRRAAEPRYLHCGDDSAITQALYRDIAGLSREASKPVAKSQRHIVAAGIISDDIQLSKQMWQVSADAFCNITVQELVNKIGALQGHIAENLAPMARNAADDADEVSKDLVTRHTFKVKSITDTIDKLLRKRRRRLRWLRKGGWVMVEWALVGVMWLVWFLVVFVRVFLGIGRGLTAATRWLLWL